MYNPERIDYQDLQEIQVAACRGFYTEVCPVSVVDAEDVFFTEDKAEIPVSPEDVDAVSEWLAKGPVWLAFKPRLIEDERGIVLVLR